MNPIQAYQMTAAKQPFERVSLPPVNLQPAEALVEVAGCGVCHTDISFWYHGVPTRQALPLVLGHEISGTVMDGPAGLLGRAVIIPAVLPCGKCDLCRRGRSNICRQQKMPGNDFHGGFASHVVVPHRFLAPVPDAVLSGYTLAELAVVADAVATPYQVVARSGLEPGDLAIVIGVGGIGIYAAQLAALQGGRVLALDISRAGLERLSQAGITHSIHTAGMDIKTIKNRVKELCGQMGAPPHSWKIFEMSGSRAGQELAFALLGVAGTLSVVGFTLEKLELRLSNLMAFDARVIGTWGCRPELYPEILDLVGAGRLHLRPFTEVLPLSTINAVFQQTLQHDRVKRAVLEPDFA